MSGLALIWDTELQGCDLVVAGAEEPAAALRTAVLISLFTDRRAAVDDTLPDNTGDRRGWWGDFAPAVEGDQIGSRLWLLARGKRTAETIRLARDYALEALQWLVLDGVAATLDVQAEGRGESGIAIAVFITRPDGGRQRFDHLWDRS